MKKSMRAHAAVSVRRKKNVSAVARNSEVSGGATTFVAAASAKQNKEVPAVVERPAVSVDATTASPAKGTKKNPATQREMTSSVP